VLKLANIVVPMLVICLLSSACSVVMVANRSSYRGDVNVIQLGVQRSVVTAELGQPDNSRTLEDGGYEDRYMLDPDAHHGATKFFTALFYVAADLFTLLLAELIFTPAEIAMRDKRVTYQLIYGAVGNLSSIEKSSFGP
jgi:hypothetical protein